MDEPRPPSPRRPLRQLLIGCLGLVGLLTLLLLGGYAYYGYRLNQDLEAAIAEAIKTDPVLNLEELVAGLEPVPVNENSALRIRAATRALPDLPELGAEISKRRANERFHDDEFRSLTSNLEKAAAALDHLRGLKDLPRGRHDVIWQREHTFIDVAHAEETRTIAMLLAHQAAALAEDNHPDEALIACRAALNAGRSLRGEPGLIPLLVRMSCQSYAKYGSERILGQQVASDDALAILQRTLEEEEREPVLLAAFRGERAVNHRICQRIASGELTVDQWLFGSNISWSPSTIDVLAGRHVIRLAHPYCLRYLTGLMRLADLPCHELKPAEIQLQGDLGKPPAIARLVVLAMDKFFDAYLANRAGLRCSRTALAAERFRLRQARWPNSLAELVPDFLDEVPLDPFDGKPLRFRPTEDGVLIYSIGRDGVDDAGQINRDKKTTAGTDIGFQLWHPEQRGLKPE